MRKIAESFGVTLDEIVAVNPQINDLSAIAVGEVVFIPVRPDPLKNVPVWARGAVKKAIQKGVVSELFQTIPQQSLCAYPDSDPGHPGRFLLSSSRNH